ncbi:MAG: prolyl oligopeptidase family serine peptidase [Pseudomonadota bacterium]
MDDAPASETRRSAAPLGVEVASDSASPLPERSTPYGYWPSPIDGIMVAGKSRRFGHVATDEGHVYWCESRPEEEGRCVICRIDAASLTTSPAEDGAATAADTNTGGETNPGAETNTLELTFEDVLPAPWSASSRVHEYGGGEFSVRAGTIWFVNAEDQDIYRMSDGNAVRVTTAPKLRFTSIAALPGGGATAEDRLFAIAERSTSDPSRPENLIVEIDQKTGAVFDRVTGRDFYAQLTLSPRGEAMAFIAWDLPDMPWDEAATYVCEISDTSVSAPRKLVGGEGVATFQPTWRDANTLAVVSDADGNGQLITMSAFARADQPVTHSAPDIDLLVPLWNIASRAHARSDDGATWAAGYRAGAFVLTRNARELETGLADLSAISALDHSITGVAARHDAPAELTAIDADGNCRTLRRSADDALDPAYVSHGEIVRFDVDGRTVPALYYPPRNDAVRAPDTPPPAIVTAHGGPTGMAKRGLTLKTQFWTSRGFAVLDVDYAGSSGYGRAWRERLDGQWGVADVDDVVAAARWLTNSGRAAPGQIAISGGSAGGYTVLMALAMSDVFNAGGCHYGIADQEQLLRCTHKFEAGYQYRLFGVTHENREPVFTARSPINLMDGFRTPTIFFQGAEDAVVPPDQSRMMVEALRRNGVPTDYHEFDGERHGFRKARTVEAVLNAELAFFRAHLGLG